MSEQKSVASRPVSTRKTFIPAIIAFCSMILLDCGGSPSPPGILESITISPSTASSPLGATQQFTALGSFSDGGTQNLTASVTWSSSNTSVATIKTSGLATGKGIGTATITAKSGSTTATAELKVTPPVVVSIAVMPSNPFIGLGGTQQFIAIGTLTDGSNQELSNSVTWNSSNPGVSAISNSGLATAKAAGTSAVTATLASHTGLTNLTVTTVVVSPRVTSLTITQTQQFQAIVQNTGNQGVIWSVDGIVGGDATVGTVSPSGLYTPPNKAGPHAIVATSQANSTQSGKAAIVVTDYPGTFTYHNDNARTGQNLNEIVLTLENVNWAQFGKLFSYPVDGQIYAQPLYVANLNIPGQGYHNVAYVATEHDSVYAFDADGRTNLPLWQVSFIDPAAGVTPVPSDAFAQIIWPEVGITGTPVIDPGGGTLYVVAYTDENGNPVYRLHALDIGTGTEKFGGPRLIQASVPGTGAGNDGHGNVPFDPAHQNQRPGLLLSDGKVYIAFGSWADILPFHGWLLAYDAQTLKQVGVFNATPNGSGGSIWQSGGAPSTDSNGNIFVMTGNGTFDADTGGVDFGDSFLKFRPSSAGLALVDYFTPFNQASLSRADLDLGSCAPLVLPEQTSSHPHLLVGAGKEGRIYLVDRDHMGHFNEGDDSQIVQSIAGAIFQNFGTPAYWQNKVYFLGFANVLTAFPLTDGLLSAVPPSQAKTSFGFPGATPAVSARAATNGIVWALQTDSFSQNGPAVLWAYDANNISRTLYNSNQAGVRDVPGVAVKFTMPTVANGRVYVGAQNELDVFGLLPE